MFNKSYTILKNVLQKIILLNGTKIAHDFFTKQW